MITLRFTLPRLKSSAILIGRVYNTSLDVNPDTNKVHFSLATSSGLFHIVASPKQLRGVHSGDQLLVIAAPHRITRSVSFHVRWCWIIKRAEATAKATQGVS